MPLVQSHFKSKIHIDYKSVLYFQIWFNKHMNYKYFFLIIFFTHSLSIHASAQTPSSLNLGFPLACTLGENCFTAHYVDMNPSPQAQDPYCGQKTYDTHKGTDFGLNSLNQMNQGIDVLAALDGKVLRTRNGESDTSHKTKELFDQIKHDKKECGNGIIIEHDNKIQTFYCHLKKDSLTVNPGDTVRKGDTIAQVGLSGLTEFPHLHFALIQDGLHIDPFTGSNNQEGCGIKKISHWEQTISYEPFTLYDHGFTVRAPNFKEIHASTYQKPTFIDKQSPALIYWIGLYHAIKDDEIKIKILDPNKKIFAENTIIIPQYKQTPSQYFVGKKTTSTKLIPGTYTAMTTLTRRLNGQVQAKKTYSKTIDIR